MTARRQSPRAFLVRGGVGESGGEKLPHGSGWVARLGVGQRRDREGQAAVPGSGAVALVRFVLLPGQRYDTVGVPQLIKGAAFGALLGDKAFDIHWLRA